MKYNKPKMLKELERLQDKLQSHEIASIAGMEQVSTNTVKNYLSGMTPVLALAQAIIENGKLIIKNRG